MTITRDEVSHVARLARLALSSKQLDRLDTRDVVPTSHAVEMGTPFREDAARPFGDKEAILANAPDRESDFFRVPRIIED